MGMYKHFWKRGLDILISGVGLICLSPLLLLLAILVRVKLGSPIIFTQERPGLNEQIFTLKKFRTMTDERDIEGNLLPDAKRLTKFGRFLRSTSLDELPQLINILKGDMSIVGPRPALWNQYDLIEERDKYAANDVRPGLTGWAQINGRDELDICQKAKLDGEYVKNMGVRLDIKCFFGTFLPVLRADGVWDGDDEKKG